MRLIRHHRTSSRKNLTIHDIIQTQPRLLQPPRHIRPVLGQRVILQVRRKEALHAQTQIQLGVHLDNLAQLLRHVLGRLPQGERLSRVNVEEDAREDDGQDHVQLLLREDALGVVPALEREVEHARDEVRVGQVADVANDVDLGLAGELVRLLGQQPLCNHGVEALDMALPSIRVQQGTHALPLSRVKLRITREHEPPTTVAHQVSQTLLPSNLVLVLILQDILGGIIRRDVDAGRLEGRTREIEAVRTLEIRQDDLVLIRRAHRVVRIHRVPLEMIRERLQEELIEGTAMIDVQVIVHLLVAPVCQILRVIIRRIVSIAAHEGNRIRQDDTRDGVRRRDADTGTHGRLGLLRDETRVQLDVVGVLVEMAERVGNLGVRVDVLEALVRLETKVLSELVQAGEVPLATSDDAQHLNRLHDTRNIATTKRTSRLLNSSRDGTDEVIIVELAILAALEAAKGSLTGVLGHRHLKLLQRRHESLHVHVAVVLTEEVDVKVLDPLLIHLGDARVPAVAEVELGRDDVANTSLGALGSADVDTHLLSGIKRPSRIDSVQVDNVSDVINQSDVDVQARCDESSSLEEFLVMLLPSSSGLFSLEIL